MKQKPACCCPCRATFSKEHILQDQNTFCRNTFYMNTFSRNTFYRNRAHSTGTHSTGTEHILQEHAHLATTKKCAARTNSKKLKKRKKMKLQEYYRSGRMMLQMAQSVGRLVLAGRELTKLAGFTSRLHEFGDVLKDLQVSL